MQAARVLWQYHFIPFERKRADIILVLGSRDLQVAEAAASVFREGLAPRVVISGGLGKITKDVNSLPEATLFAMRCIEKGVPIEAIIEERKATNTGDNFLLSRSLLEALGIHVRTGIIVTKPYMRRRALATGAKQWAEVDWQVCSDEISLENYLASGIDEAEVLNLMVGDLQRLKVYAERGFQTEQEIPPHVWDAFHTLVQAGYDRFLLK